MNPPPKHYIINEVPLFFSKVRQILLFYSLICFVFFIYDKLKSHSCYVPVKCFLTLSVSSVLLVLASVTYSRNNICNCFCLPTQRSVIEMIWSFL